MMLKRVFLVYFITLISTAYGDEIPVPEFSGEVVKYVDRYGGKFFLGERTPKKLKFWFQTIGGNNHQCHMTGVAKSRDNETYKYGRFERNTHCSLSIIVLDDSVVLIDESNQCKIVSCGQRAGINGAVFHRVK